MSTRLMEPEVLLLGEVEAAMASTMKRAGVSAPLRAAVLREALRLGLRALAARVGDHKGTSNNA